ncbi:hypothetical protein Zm00014a_033455 [Zea mays]|uniref:Uncharacterized protein n=1 Tax=Zea mays TaxID=4577 RepID=A0A317YHG9_MAIZE|nr:hypothetical protein Zm00014a_033455 [Zea mays]
MSLLSAASTCCRAFYAHRLAWRDAVGEDVQADMLAPVLLQQAVIHRARAQDTPWIKGYFSSRRLRRSCTSCGSIRFHRSGKIKQKFGIVSSEDMAEHAYEDRYANVDLVCALCDNGGKIVRYANVDLVCALCDNGGEIVRPQFVLWFIVVQLSKMKFNAYGLNCLGVEYIAGDEQQPWGGCVLSLSVPTLLEYWANDKWTTSSPFIREAGGLLLY